MPLGSFMMYPDNDADADADAGEYDIYDPNILPDFGYYRTLN